MACGVNNYDYNLSFSRTFVFFPFFLIGHFYHLQIREPIQRHKLIKYISVSLLALFLTIIFVHPEIKGINVGWLYGSKSYSVLKMDWSEGVIYRFILYITAFLIGISLLALMSNNRNKFTRYGSDSLYIYVLHGFVMKALIVWGMYKYIDTWWKAVILIVLSLLLLPVLSAKPFKLIADQMMNPLGLHRILLADKTKVAGKNKHNSVNLITIMSYLYSKLTFGFRFVIFRQVAAQAPRK